MSIQLSFTPLRPLILPSNPPCSAIRLQILCPKFLGRRILFYKNAVFLEDSVSQFLGRRIWAKSSALHCLFGFRESRNGTDGQKTPKHDRPGGRHPGPPPKPGRPPRRPPGPARRGGPAPPADGRTRGRPRVPQTGSPVRRHGWGDAAEARRGPRGGRGRRGACSRPTAQRNQRKSWFKHGPGPTG